MQDNQDQSNSDQPNQEDQSQSKSSPFQAMGERIRKVFQPAVTIPAFAILAAGKCPQGLARRQAHVFIGLFGLQ